jgi:hypothetical protein
MKPNIKSKKKYNIKKSKGNQKTQKKNVKRGGAMKLGIPGFGEAGTCTNTRKYNPTTGNWDTQECYEINGNKFYKTVQNNNAVNEPTNTNSCWPFW